MSLYKDITIASISLFIRHTKTQSPYYGALCRMNDITHQRNKRCQSCPFYVHLLPRTEFIYPAPTYEECIHSFYKRSEFDKGVE